MLLAQDLGHGNNDVSRAAAVAAAGLGRELALEDEVAFQLVTMSAEGTVVMRWVLGGPF